MGLTEGDQLPSLIAAFFRGFTTSLVGGVDLAPINAQWELITSELEQRQCNGELHPDLAAQAYSVAKNTVSLGSALRDLRNELDESMEGMTSELQGLLREDIKPSAVKRLYSGVPCRNSKRPCRPLSFAYDFSYDSSSDSDDYTPTAPRLAKSKSRTAFHPAPCTPSPCKPTPTDHLRLWFLQNLSNPYPTPYEKESLATAAGCPRSKVDSDLTNWRRRAGWTDIKDRWVNGDKAKMKRLIEDVEGGHERRGEVVEEVERMRGYLERREGERVGDWVHELTSLVEKKPITNQSENRPHTHSLVSVSSHSSLSATSHQIPQVDSPFSFRSSSSSSTSSSSLAYLFNPGHSLKRGLSLDGAESSTGQRMKLESSSSSSPSEMEAEPLWFTGYTTPPIEGQSTPAMEYVDSTSMCPTPLLSAGIWSTETPLLTLPHVTMGAERSNSGGMNGFGGFEMPSQWAFEPVLDGWMSGM